MTAKSDILFSSPLHQPLHPCQTVFTQKKKERSSKGRKELPKHSVSFLLFLCCSPDDGEGPSHCLELKSCYRIPHWKESRGQVVQPNGYEVEFRSLKCWASCVNACLTCVQGEWSCTPSSVYEPLPSYFVVYVVYVCMQYV